VQVSVIICLFTKIVACVGQATQRQTNGTVFECTNPHHTEAKNSAHLKITKFSCIKLKKIIYFSVIFSKILDHVTQINSEIIKSFLRLASQLMRCNWTCPLYARQTFTRVKFR